jgi:general secretion pathway protein G
MKKRSQIRRAFTLVELLVVIVIISMLAAFVAPNVIKHVGKAKVDLAKPRMAIIEDAIGRFYMDCGRYPTDSEGLEALLVDPGNTTGWNGPYVKQSQVLDPWNNVYIYVAEGTVNPGNFDLICLGADGQEGGDGENADIYND